MALASTVIHKASVEYSLFYLYEPEILILAKKRLL